VLVVVADLVVEMVLEMEVEMEVVLEMAGVEEEVEVVVDLDLVLVAAEYPVHLHQKRNASPCPKPTAYLCPSNPVPTYLLRNVPPAPSRSASMFHLLNLKENANQ